jgi:hypothetical protein
MNFCLVVPPGLIIERKEFVPQKCKGPGTLRINVEGLALVQGHNKPVAPGIVDVHMRALHLSRVPGQSLLWLLPFELLVLLAKRSLCRAI